MEGCGRGWKGGGWERDVGKLGEIRSREEQNNSNQRTEKFAVQMHCIPFCYVWCYIRISTPPPPCPVVLYTTAAVGNDLLVQ